ncbi:MAG: sulfate adenylyltransferase subunit 1 [Bradymonadaceae bacterium]
MSNEQPLRTAIVGHVDHGKSTLVGRMLYETDSLEEGKYEKVQNTCEKRGVPFEWAFLLDALQAERNQNVTIDTAQIWFESDLRPYCIIDAPGHKEFLKNMVTGAASADAALLLIAADEGVQEQSRRHCYMLSMLGIEQVTVAVNKMDLVDYDQERYENIVEEYRTFLEEIGVEPRSFVPVSAREGDNLVDPPEENMPWWEGRTILEELDAFDRPKTVTERGLRFPIQDIYRFDNRRILAGRIESGELEVGQELLFTPHHKKARVETIEGWSQPDRESVRAGESVGITLSKEIFVERGHVASDADSDDQPEQTAKFRANVFWLGTEPLEMGEPYKVKLGTTAEEATIVEIERIMDGANLEPLDEDRQQIERYDVAEVLIETRRPIAVDLYNEQPTVGRFVIVDDYDVAGGGIITGIEQRERADVEDTRRVTADERASRVGHRGALVRVEAPTTAVEDLGAALERGLFDRGVNALLLDDLEDEVDARSIGNYLSRAGAVALATDPEADEFAIDIDGEERIAFSEEESAESIVERLLPLLRTEEVEKRMEATV